MNDFDLYMRCMSMLSQPYNHITARYVDLAQRRILSGRRNWLADSLSTKFFEYRRQQYLRHRP